TFLKNLKSEMEAEIAQASAYLLQLDEEQDEYLQVKTLIASRAFLAKEEQNFRRQWAICQSLNACSSLPEDPFKRLAHAIYRRQRLAHFTYEASDPVSKTHASRLLALLQGHGYSVTRDGNHTTPTKVARASCHSRIFPSFAATVYHIAEVDCQVDFIVQG